jgi:hypothetical protein
MKAASVALQLHILAGFTQGRGDDGTPQAKLDEAKARYQKEMAAYREEVKAYFDQREDAARKDGNKKLVDAILAEKRRFDETNALPKSAAPLIQRGTAIRAAMTKSYQQAVKEFTMAKQDDAAAQAEQELQAFTNLLGTWVDPNSGGHVFVFKFGGEISEFDAKGQPNAKGEWAVDKAGKVTANLSNGHTISGPLPKLGSMRLDVFPPGRTTATLTLTIRRVVK